MPSTPRRLRTGLRAPPGPLCWRNWRSITLPLPKLPSAAFSRLDSRWRSYWLRNGARPGSFDAKLESSLSLALAEGDLGRAAEIDETASRLADEFQGGHNSYGYWYRIARVPFLVRTGRADVATRLAEEAISQLNGSPDRALLDRVRAAGALAFAELGNPRKSVGLVEDVALGPLGRIPELVASVETALGNIAGLSDVHVHEHLNRAARIYAHVGHETGRAAALRDSEQHCGFNCRTAILRGAESRSIRSRSTGTSCRRWHRWRVVARCGRVGGPGISSKVNGPRGIAVDRGGESCVRQRHYMAEVHGTAPRARLALVQTQGSQPMRALSQFPSVKSSAFHTNSS